MDKYRSGEEVQVSVSQTRACRPVSVEVGMTRFLFSVFFLFCSPVMAAPSVWLYNISQDRVTVSDRGDQVRAIASLTKIMTAIVAYEHNPDMTQSVRPAPGTQLPAGRATRGDLFVSLLVRSDNAAAEQLARDYPGGRTAFIEAMNHRAKAMGLVHTRFRDASGLDAGNRSTAQEMAQLTQAAMTYPILGAISSQSQAQVTTDRAQAVLRNTNRDLLQLFDRVNFSKTGYTRAAGRNVAMLVQYQSQEFVVVVMGAASREHRLRLARDTIQQHMREIDRDIRQWTRS